MPNLVSVVMTVFNAQDYLRESIESILIQTFSDYEFIIIDDCSTDQSLQIALEYKDKDPRILVHHHETNMGIAAARNTGVRLATGKYIAWMDADDISHPERLEKELNYLEKNPQVGVVGSDANLVDWQGKKLDVVHMPETHLLIEWSLCFFDPIINPSVMINREVYSIVGEYRNLSTNKKDYFPEDYDLWVRVINTTQFHNINEPLINLRKHDYNITKTLLSSTIQNSMLICGWYLESLKFGKLSRSNANVLWEIENFSHLFKFFIVNTKIYSGFLRKDNISLEEKKYIRIDYWNRVKTYLRTARIRLQAKIRQILIRKK